MADPISAGMAIVGGFVSFSGSMRQAEAQELAGRWNQDVAIRDARIAETLAGESLLQGKRDVMDFMSQYKRFEKTVEASLIASGFDPNSGTALEIKMANAEQADIDLAKIEINAARDAADLREQAVASKLSGELARFEGKTLANAARTKAMVSFLRQGAEAYRYAK